MKTGRQNIMANYDSSQTPGMTFRGKRVLLLGLGLHGGGVGVAKFLLRNGARLTINDLRSRRELAPSIKELEKFRIPRRPPTLRYVLGKHRRSDILSADLIVKGPGIKPDAPFLALAKRRGIPVTSEMGIFFALNPAKIIGVTGTRGKSTTAYLIWKLLKTKFKGRRLTPLGDFRLLPKPSRGHTRRVFLGGNIRKSALEFLPKLGKEDWVVLELSSFQLDDLWRSRFHNSLGKRDLCGPDIAVITNIMRDHLNWHGSMASYVRAKSRIFARQKSTDYLIVNPQDGRLQTLAKKAPSKVVAARLPKNLRLLVDRNLGRHYRVPAALAYAVAKLFGVGDRRIRKVLRNFHGLEGRQEKIAETRGVTFINDTTATIPEATIAALQRFHPLAKMRGGKIILIAGGADKKLDFREMARAVKKYVDALVLLPGTATEKIKKCFSGRSQRNTLNPPSLSFRKGGLGRIFNVNSMREAVKIARKLAGKGDYVILSPGAASFGLFLNEFDRGKQFVDSVHKLRMTN